MMMTTTTMVMTTTMMMIDLFLGKRNYCVHTFAYKSTCKRNKTSFIYISEHICGNIKCKIQRNRKKSALSQHERF